MTTGQDRPGASTADAFDRSHQGRMHSATVERIYRSAFGGDYAAGAQPNAFYSRTTLQFLVGALRQEPGRTLVDLGCGHGGPGLWTAQHTGASLAGIDLSPAGVALAGRRAAELGLGGQATFRVGDVTATGLPDAYCDGAISLDVLPFVPGKAAPFREVARILRPGGRFAFTTWERLGAPAGADSGRDELAASFRGHPLLDSAHTDYRSLAEQAGLAVETYQEPPDWRRQQRAVMEGIIAAEAQVTGEMGAHYPAMARVFLAALPMLRYIAAVTRRQPETRH